MQKCVHLALQTDPNLITARLLQVALATRALERTKNKQIEEQLTAHITKLLADGYLELPELMYSDNATAANPADSLYRPFAQENQQEGKPSGYHGEVLTLSKGRYDEFLVAKPIESIGNVRFNTLTKKIVGFGENKRRVEVVSRFLSVDPLAASYPELTPYQFASNTPIWAIDLDGLEGVVILGFDAFAPFDFFGFGFEGDGNNRTFDHTGTKKFRAKAVFEIDVDKNTVKNKPVDFAYSNGLWGYGTNVVSETEVKSFSMKKGKFDAHIEAGNDAVLLFVDSDATDLANGGITIRPSLSFERNNNILSISGSIKGDAFPSNEGYLKDEHGNSIFLGVYPIHATVACIPGGKDTAPFFWLMGTGDTDMYRVNMQVRFNTDGKIDGVKGTRWSGQNSDIVWDFISPDEWNQHFTNTKPVETEKKD
jgi:hypothetical protein